MSELSIIQKTYDLIKWYVPLLNRLPRDHKFILGDRIIVRLYDILENLIQAKYAKEKLAILEQLNVSLDLLRHQTRLLLDFELIEAKRYEYASKLINEIGSELGGWLKQQKQQNRTIALKFDRNSLQFRSCTILRNRVSGKNSAKKTIFFVRNPVSC